MSKLSASNKSSSQPEIFGKRVLYIGVNHIKAEKSSLNDIIFVYLLKIFIVLSLMRLTFNNGKKCTFHGSYKAKAAEGGDLTFQGKLNYVKVKSLLKSTLGSITKIRKWL